MTASETATSGTACFSRPTSSSMPGKRSVALKTTVTDETAEDFARFARERGYGTGSDALHELILVALYGVDFLTDLHRKRINSLGVNRYTTVPAAEQEEGSL